MTGRELEKQVEDLKSSIEDLESNIALNKKMLIDLLDLRPQGDLSESDTVFYQGSRTLESLIE